jgi:hypothetical protein
MLPDGLGGESELGGELRTGHATALERVDQTPPGR